MEPVPFLRHGLVLVLDRGGHMRRILLFLVALTPVIAMAGFPFEATLDEMAQQADHILVGRVAGVDMVDAHGNPVNDPEARTGTSLDNTIRLRAA